VKKLALIISLFFSSLCAAQSDTVVQDTAWMDFDTIPFKWPYYGPYIPPWYGVVAGYEGWNLHCWEVGVAFHLANFHSDNKKGQITGGMLTYKQSFTGRLKTVELEAGFYTPFTIGVGLNENFYEGTATFGFRPFIGTSLWHIQLIAGYNFYSKRQTNISDLDHFTLKFRYVLPVRSFVKSADATHKHSY
jgi:hypothetical protein